MQDFIKINKDDNVAVALKPIAKGTTLNVAGIDVTTVEDIPQGHKFVIKAIKKGEPVVKYGFKLDLHQKIKGVIDMDVKDPDTGKILIRRGAPVRIDTKIEKPRGKGRPGKITLNLLSTESVDGKNIRLSRTAEFSGKSRRGLALGLGIGLPLGTIVCFPWGFACLAIKGLHAEVPAGTILDYVIVAEDYTITPR